MTLALLLPPYLSNLYDLAAILNSDRILLDDISAYSRKSRVHRGKIRTPDGTQWINIPVLTEDKKKPIREVRIDHSKNWVELNLKALAYNYRNSIYYDHYEPEIRADFEYGNSCDKLIEFTAHFFERLMLYLQLDMPKMEFASDLADFDHDPDQIAKKFGAEQIFTEHNSRNYQRQSSVTGSPALPEITYRQHFDCFEPECCLLDVLFQYGPESFRVTDQLLID